MDGVRVLCQDEGHTTRRKPQPGDRCANEGCTFHTEDIPLDHEEIIQQGDNIYCSDYCWDEL